MPSSIDDISTRRAFLRDMFLIGSAVGTGAGLAQPLRTPPKDEQEQHPPAPKDVYMDGAKTTALGAVIGASAGVGIGLAGLVLQDQERSR